MAAPRFGSQVHFIGVTALGRTNLPHGRSEDVDLIAIKYRKTVAADMDAALPRALARTHGRRTLDPGLAPSAIPARRFFELPPASQCGAVALRARQDSVANRATVALPAVHRLTRPQNCWFPR